MDSWRGYLEGEGSYLVSNVGSQVAFKVLDGDRLHGGGQHLLPVLNDEGADALQKACHPVVNIVNPLPCAVKNYQELC